MLTTAIGERTQLVTVSMPSKDTGQDSSPHLQLERLVLANQAKVVAVTGDHNGADRTGCEGDKRIEMKVADPPRIVAVAFSELREDLPRPFPLPDTGGIDACALLEIVHEAGFFSPRCSAPQL